MRTKYNLLTVVNGSGYMQRSAHMSEYRSAASFADSRDSRRLLPVHGIPMPAKDTLLAQMLKSNGRSAAAVMRGDVHLDPICTAAQCIRAAKAHFTPASSEQRPDPVRMAKRITSLSGHLIGVEIECYPRNGYIESDGLTDVVGDGSLRWGGVEVRRITWANSSGRLGGLLGLKDKLAGAKVDSTCGLHVHIDVRHLPAPGAGGDDRMVYDAAETYDRLTLLYPMLKKLVPKSRWSNRYCRLYNNRPDSATYQCPRNGQRYAGINWCSYAEHKTIEFRLAPGSTNLVKIESWALLCKYLVNWCANKNNQVPTTWTAFLAILPEWMASWCIVRNMKLHGSLARLDVRVGSAADMDLSGETVQ